MKTTRWAIVGTGKIARKFASDLRVLPNHSLVAIASRSAEKARAFADEYPADKLYASYESLAADANAGVDAVYIATPHSGHMQHSLLFLQAGMAVLCEKPLAVNTAQVARMFAAAKASNTLLMEALWTLFLPPVRKAFEWIADGQIGRIKAIRTSFGYKAPYLPEWRLFNPDLAGGALLDIGIYTLLLPLALLPDDVENLAVNFEKAPTGVDRQSAVQFTLGAATVQAFSSLTSQLDNTGWIFGTDGSIELPMFWRANEAVLHRPDSTIRFTDKRETFGYNYEAEAVGQLLELGSTESELASAALSFRLIRTMDAIRWKMDLVYPGE